MNKLLKILTPLNIIVCCVIIAVYAVILFKQKFLSEVPIGDEFRFLESFKLFLTDGYYVANVDGNSIVFNGMSYVFSMFGFDPLQSIRMASLFSGVLTVILLWYFIDKYFAIPKLHKIVAFITAIHSMVVITALFSGINDVVMVWLTLMFFLVVYKEKNSNKPSFKSYFLIGLIIALMLLTRKMSVILIPSISAVLMFHYLRYNISLLDQIKKWVVTITTFVLMVALLNLPSLIEKGKLSFHDKEPKMANASWAQLQYLSAIKAEQGEIVRGHHVSWETLQDYIEINGKDSLPNNLLSSLTHDPKRTAKEFFLDLVREVKPFTRLMGLLFIAGLILFIYKIIKREVSWKRMVGDDIYVFSAIYVIIICFIVIYVVENRWFGNILILLPVVFCHSIYTFLKTKRNEKHIGILLLNAQLLSLTLMNLPYVYQNFTN